jgi:hypothetical protein
MGHRGMVPALQKPFCSEIRVRTEARRRRYTNELVCTRGSVDKYNAQCRNRNFQLSDVVTPYIRATI